MLLLKIIEFLLPKSNKSPIYKTKAQNQKKEMTENDYSGNWLKNMKKRINKTHTNTLERQV